MGWKGLERNKLDFILTDLLPVEVSELFSFTNFYDFLTESSQQKVINSLLKEFYRMKAAGGLLFENGWGTRPLKYRIHKGTASTREMSIIQPCSALNLFFFIERIRKLDNPILWGVILCYSRYHENFFKKLLEEVELVIDDKIDRISKKEAMMYEEFWYVLIFHIGNIFCAPH